jgi:hypothetical protein
MTSAKLPPSHLIVHAASSSISLRMEPETSTDVFVKIVAKVVQLIYCQRSPMSTTAAGTTGGWHMTIQGMRYDEVAQVLTVSFRGWGGTRRYFEVPPSEWATLNAVFAKATYLQQELAPRRRNELLRAA